MIIKQLIDEDFSNYKKASMLIGFPHCNSFKCEKDSGERICQNSSLATSKDIKVDENDIVSRYINNPITNAIIFGGLEPMDDFNELINFITTFRYKTDDDIVIYTGYYEYELVNEINILKQYKNIIVKFGRYIPNQNKHFDEVLGINLASDNQYGKRLN